MRGRLVVLTMVAVMGLTLGVREAAALDVGDIEIVQGSARTDGTIMGWFFEISVEGTGLKNGCVFWNQHLAGDNISGNDWEPFTTSADNAEARYYATFASQAALEAVHPTSNRYDIFVNPTKPSPTTADFTDRVNLGFTASRPSGFADITYPLHNATGVPLNPTYTWDNVDGFGEALGMFVVDTAADDEVHQNIPDNDMTRMTWQPGLLAPSTHYRLEVGVGDLTAGDNQILTMLTGDPFEVLRAYVDVNHVEFDTIPEPSTVAFVGTGLLVCIGLRRRRRLR